MFNSKNKLLLLIVILIGVIIRIALIQFSTDISFGTDAPTYDDIAQNIAFKGTYPTTIYPPVYPLLVAGIYHIFGYKPVLINYLHIILYILACISVFKLASVLFNPKTAVYAVIFFSIEPISVFYSVLHMPEVLVAIFLPLSIYFLIKFFKSDSGNKPKYGLLVYSSIVLGLAMLTKPILFYFPVVIIFLIIVYMVRAPRKVITAFLIAAISICLIISTWLIRNYRMYNRFCFADSISFFYPVKNSIIKHTAMSIERLYTRPSLIRGQAVRYMFGTNSVLLYRACFGAGGVKLFDKYQSGKERIFKQDGQIRFLLSSNMRDYITLFGYSRRFALFNMALTIILFVIYGFGLAGVFFMLKNRKTKELILLISIIVYFALIIIIALCGSRHRFPSIPFYSILAGYGLEKLLASRKLIPLTKG